MKYIVYGLQKLKEFSDEKIAQSYKDYKKRSIKFEDVIIKKEK